jgi:uncharacterized membrane protein (DUF485 family)
MKRQNNLLLWILFFITTTITFGLITVPSYFYWSTSKDLISNLATGVIGSIAFGAIYATYKLRTLYELKVVLSFDNMEELMDLRIEKELIRLGYRPQGGGIYIAGFRSDYYMSPDIIAKADGNEVAFTGPKFYIKKLQKRHNRWVRRNNKNKG